MSLPQHVFHVVGGDFRCTALVAGGTDGLCGAEAVAHVIWDEEGENGRACADHLAYATSFPHELVHGLSVECVMPGSLLIWDENRCEMPENYGGPVLSVARELEMASS